MLGEHLRKYRISHNLTQEQMAKLIGIRQCAYSLYENNKLRPGITMVNRIAKVLGVEPSFIRNLLW